MMVEKTIEEQFEKELPVEKKIITNKASRWRLAFLIFFLLILAAFLGYNYFKQPFLKNFKRNESVVDVIPVSEEEEIETGKRELTVEEKIAQLIAVPVDLDNFSVATAAAVTKEETPLVFDWIRQHNPGFILYFGTKVEPQTVAGASDKILGSFSDDEYLPLLAVDHEGGSVQRLSGEGFTKLPSWRSLTQTSEGSDSATIRREYIEDFTNSAKELRAVGINLVFAPVLDIAPSGNGVLGDRVGIGRDQTLTVARDFIEIFSSQQIMPVIKHFPGIGSIKRDLHTQVETTVLGEDDTQIFADILDDYSNIGVMTAHVRLKDKLDGKACSLSSDCLGQLGEFYPDALIISDDLLMAAARYQAGTSEEKDLGEVAIEAIEAGNHVLLFGPGVNLGELTGVLLALEEEYQDSASFRQQVDLAVEKVLQLKR